MDSELIWKKILNVIKTEVEPHNFRAWFGKATLNKFSEEEIVISAPSAFISEQLNLRYSALIEAVSNKVTGRKKRVRFLVVTSNNLKKDSTEYREDDFFNVDSQKITVQINPKFTLENFVVGPSNNVAFAAAQAVCANPGTSYNPLFIYGGTGVGKTHLMLGIANNILRKHPQSKIIYCSSEKFMNDYVTAIQNHKMLDLRNKYRSIQIFLVDDIQFFSGREGTQEEFFHTFNELQSKNAQIVLTSDRSPHEIEKLEDRLKSRFVGGLMVDIQPPDFDTRVAILKSKCEEKGLKFDEDSLRLIASSTESNIRELEGKLMQIIQILTTHNLKPSPETIAPYLNKQFRSIKLDYKQVLSAVCRYFNLTIKDLTGPRRVKELILPRHLLMYLLSEELGMTVEKIGSLLGGRDHTTVMHGRDRVKKLISQDREIQKIFIEVKQSIL
jgi:chromosomal replication initiator protein